MTSPRGRLDGAILAEALLAGADPDHVIWCAWIQMQNDW